MMDFNTNMNLSSADEGNLESTKTMDKTVVR